MGSVRHLYTRKRIKKCNDFPIRDYVPHCEKMVFFYLRRTKIDDSRIVVGQQSFPRLYCLKSSSDLDISKDELSCTREKDV
jgi:hypothetical protein